MNDNERYESIQDPTGQWLIWDGNENLPAIFGEFMLIGLSEKTAQELCLLMNRKHSRRPGSHPGHAHSPSTANRPLVKTRKAPKEKPAS